MENNELIIRKNGEITKYKSSKKVVSSGNGACVYIPKELLGKEVNVSFESIIQKCKTVGEVKKLSEEAK